MAIKAATMAPGNKTTALPHYVRTYGTARFKIQACVRMRRMHFAICYEHFSKLCISVGNCTGILCAIYDSVYMIA